VESYLHSPNTPSWRGAQLQLFTFYFMTYSLHREAFQVKALHVHLGLTRPDRLWGPPSLLSNGQLGVSSELKLPWREVDH